jgi:alginate O-acetyltransferase complex protein AlgI
MLIHAGLAAGPGLYNRGLLFTEPAFLFVFLPAALGLYYASPRFLRNTVLAGLSFVFYALGEQAFLPWFILSIGLNYLAALAIDRSSREDRRRLYLAVGITSDLLLLSIFKYAGFFVSELQPLLAWLGFRAVPIPQLVLPLGISFFTFHKISYKVDVYRRVCAAKSSPVDLALYLLLFPQLIAGPIVRFKEMVGDLEGRRESIAHFFAGIQRFAIGFSKKMLLANPLGRTVDRIFADNASVAMASLPPETAWLGIVCYAGQIYFDFSGYSDMAIGLARMFGFVFPENFNYPYVARSVTEFWRRWHMSLSRWFRDYLYVPLGGNRISPARTHLNLCIVSLLCGLWHGAAGRFIVWGAWHGALLAVERAGLGATLDRLPRWLGHIYTLLAVLVAWVFFRAESLGDGLRYLQAMFLLGHPDPAFRVGIYWGEMFAPVLFLAVLLSIPVRPWLAAKFESHPAGYPALAWQGAYSLVLVSGFALSLALVASNAYNPFIYFRF